MKISPFSTLEENLVQKNQKNVVVKDYENCEPMYNIFQKNCDENIRNLYFRLKEQTSNSLEKANQATSTSTAETLGNIKLDECEKVFKDYKKHKNVFPNLSAYCSKNYKNECDEVVKGIDKICENLKSTFEKFGLDSRKSIITTLWGSKSNITIRQCSAFTQQCYYFVALCPNEDLCKMLDLFWLKARYKISNLNVIWKKFRGLPSNNFTIFNPRNRMSNNSFLLKHIPEVCAELGGANEMLFRWCLDGISNPNSLYEKFWDDVSARQ
ncbi:uncharacterized protein T551_01655 [Pneumocystis jirovecii RU7]|uniref:Uncharacterized protein n=1 Tax=Pneumocystis jirovecii (strain RU7) TaxID=1408657 RepID=A0A0W4ZRV6_PNEJ7|nr:uncharacterized protein T551_01655 [Pneumocystis jirovecii RU7]KTW31103.1 hypothetical protein T551_01655 [Pneumocystis jirovecii RU7]